MHYDIPILFVIFNRLDVAVKTFEIISNVKPSVLYIAQDGPRALINGESEITDSVRKAIVSRIDWDCEVKTLFQETNLGCGNGVYTAISWFLQDVDYGIIIEDDCIANSTFFAFMREMLLKFKDDERIGMIAGTNPIQLPEYKYSYCFSNYKSCWGWATWRRAWKNMDIEMNWRNDSLQSILISSGFCGKDVSNWKYKLKCIDRKVVSAWDWQWYFSLAAQNQLCIYPAVNLVSNIGNDAKATHTSLGNITLEAYPLSFPLKHPKYVLPDAKFDEGFYRNANSFRIRILRMIPQGFKKFIKRTLIHLINK